MIRFDTILITKWFILDGCAKPEKFDLASRGFWSKAVVQQGFELLNVIYIFEIEPLSDHCYAYKYVVQ